MKTKCSSVLELGAGVCRVTPIFAPYVETIHLNDIVGEAPNVKCSWNAFKEMMTNNDENKTSARVG